MPDLSSKLPLLPVDLSYIVLVMSCHRQNDITTVFGTTDQRQRFKALTGKNPVVFKNNIDESGKKLVSGSLRFYSPGSIQYSPLVV